MMFHKFITITSKYDEDYQNNVLKYTQKGVVSTQKSRLQHITREEFRFTKIRAKNSQTSWVEFKVKSDTNLHANIGEGFKLCQFQ